MLDSNLKTQFFFLTFDSRYVSKEDEKTILARFNAQLEKANLTEHVSEPHSYVVAGDKVVGYTYRPDLLCPVKHIPAGRLKDMVNEACAGLTTADGWNLQARQNIEFICTEYPNNELSLIID